MKSFEKTIGVMSATLHGVVVSSILIPAAISSLFAGSIADQYGRTSTIVTGAVIFGVGATLESVATKLAPFIVGRVITGIGEGLFLSLLVVYICEVTPARQRGPLASIIQFLVTVGLAAGYFISYGTTKIESSASWRLPLAFQAFLAFCFAAACTMIPPSPRWLLSKGRLEEAAAAWTRLQVPVEEQEIDQANLEVAKKASGKGLWENIKFTLRGFSKVVERSARKQTALGCFLMAMQQFSGIDGVLYYAPLLFRQAGLSSEQASFLASGVSALVILAVTIPASIFSDHWGRRSSTLIGGVLIATCMLLIGSLYASNSVHGNEGAGRWVVIVTIYIFTVVFSATWAIGFRTYSSEIQPPLTRASATSLAQSSNWVLIHILTFFYVVANKSQFANWIVAFTTPILLAKSSFGVYFLFGGTTLLTVIVCIFFMPETRGKTLEAIDASFRSRSRPSQLRMRSLRTRIEA